MQWFNSVSPKMAPILSPTGAKQQSGSKPSLLLAPGKKQTTLQAEGNVKTKRRTEIIIETDRLLILRRNTARVFTQCDRCRARIEMVTPTEAAAIAGVSVRTINRWVENGVLHFAETKEGLLLICPNFPPLAPLQEVNNENI